MSFKHLTKNVPLTLDTKLLTRLRKHSIENGLVFNVDKLTEIYSFWMENICVASHYTRDQKLANQAETINKILFDVAPDLMFINTAVMKERLNKFSQLGFINNRDKLYLFTHSPYGWFLQDWSQLSIKFNYIQYRIMPWLLEKEDDPFPEPHPLIRTCKALELPYNRIKSRFLWISSAGIKPTKLNDKGGDRLNLWRVIHNLLLSDKDYFVKTATPGTKREEYEFFEKMIGSTETIEDQIMSSLTDLSPSEASNFLGEHEDENIRELAPVEFKRLKDKYN